MWKAAVAITLALFGLTSQAAWDYMAQREQLEFRMSDDERAYMRKHADSEAAAHEAFAVVYETRRRNQTYLDAGPAKSTVAFTAVALRDLLMWGVYAVVVLAFRRWIPATLVSCLIASAAWAALRNTGPWGPVNLWMLWGQLLAALFATTAVYGLLRTILSIRDAETPRTRHPPAR